MKSSRHHEGWNVWQVSLRPVRCVLFMGCAALLANSLSAREGLPPINLGLSGKNLKKARVIGLDRATRRLGREMPQGRGVVVGHVEGKEGQYTPAGGFHGVTFLKRSGPSTRNAHAQATANVLFGRRGLAPGVSLVHSFSAIDWMRGGYLQAGGGPPVDDSPVRVFSHSWVGKGGAMAPSILRRLDYQVDTLGVLNVVGVNNGRQSRIPPLLASSYNTIAVGSGTGESSGGFTRVETEGRCKPDLVAPGAQTSFSTPVVTACAARLLEYADRLADNAAPRSHLASRPEVIKAVLMAGADKPADWAPSEGRPLDEYAGAGVVNIDHALRIIKHGPLRPGVIRDRCGWDYRPLPASSQATYRFDLREAMAEVSLLMTWHRRIDGRVATLTRGTSRVRAWLDVPRLCDMDLRLTRLADSGVASTVASSTSRVDNVEHLYFETLPPGRYRLTVSRGEDAYNEDWTYALAWRMHHAEH